MTYEVIIGHFCFLFRIIQNKRMSIVFLKFNFKFEVKTFFINNQ